MRWAIGFLLVINVTIFLWGNLTQSSANQNRGWNLGPSVSSVQVASRVTLSPPLSAGTPGDVELESTDLQTPVAAEPVEAIEP